MSTATATMNPMQAGAPAPAANLPATTGGNLPAAQPNAPGAEGGALATMPPSGAIAQVKQVLGATERQTVTARDHCVDVDCCYGVGLQLGSNATDACLDAWFAGC